MSVLEQIDTVGLEEAKAVRLMNRMERKYVASADRLDELLERVSDHYFVQQVNGDRIAPYRTLYFDTDDLAMYTMHHNGKLNRQKLRVRTYCSSDTTFFEIKNKDNKGKTSKMRLPMDVQMFDHPEEVPEVREFVVRNTPFALCVGIRGGMRLQACLENRFGRITLVDRGMKERVTIDRGIAFHNRVTGWDADLGGLLVIEVKHEAGTPMSEMERTLHEMHVRPQRMSKYCIGTALTNPSAKKNRFKPMMLYIDNLKSSIVNHQSLTINH